MNRFMLLKRGEGASKISVSDSDRRWNCRSGSRTCLAWRFIPGCLVRIKRQAWWSSSYRFLFWFSCRPRCILVALALAVVINNIVVFMVDFIINFSFQKLENGIDCGSRLHGVCKENPLAPLIGRLGLPLYRTSGDNSVLYDHDLER
jgi:hypothetical protein